MRYAEFSAQHIADAMARAHRHSARERTHRQPCAQLAIEPCGEVLRLRLDAWQRARKQRKSSQRLRVAKDMRFIRADAFDAMVHRTNAGRRPESHSGVCSVIAGSSTTALGMVRRWRSSSLTFVRSSVTPAKALKSPADRVVGTLICLIIAGIHWRRADDTIRSLHRAQLVDGFR